MGEGLRANGDTSATPDDGDSAAVLDIGFPRRRGGPFHWADRVGPPSCCAGSRGSTVPRSRPVPGWSGWRPKVDSSPTSGGWHARIATRP